MKTVTLKKAGRGCPHCGDTQHGVNFEWTLREERWESWDGNEADTHSSVCVRVFKIKCAACGKRVKKAHFGAPGACRAEAKS